MLEIKISYKYISQYKPTIMCTHYNRKIIYVKQFFYFYFFLNAFKKIETLHFKKAPSLIIFKKTNKLPGFLRAPYRHKKAQINLKRISYYTIINSTIHINQLVSEAQLVHCLEWLFNNWSFFDSPLLSLLKQSYNIKTTFLVYNKL